MPAPDIEYRDDPLPGYRGLQDIAIGTEDVVLATPRFVRVLSAGDLIYVDSLGEEHTLAGMSPGDDVVGPIGGAVYVKTIRGSSTVSSVQLGIT